MSDSFSSGAIGAKRRIFGSNVLCGLFVALCFLLPARIGIAQSTIFNIPTTDTVSKGKGYFEFDYLPQLPKPDGVDRLQIINPTNCGWRSREY
jgi:hypothetical protein